MALQFDAPQYDGGRIVARTGQVEVGAVFPHKDGSAMWSFWLGRRSASIHHVKAKTILAAKSEILARFREWLRLADLVEAACCTHEAQGEGEK